MNYAIRPDQVDAGMTRSASSSLATPWEQPMRPRGSVLPRLFPGRVLLTCPITV